MALSCPHPPSTRVGANTVPASTADWTRGAGDSLSEFQTLQSDLGLQSVTQRRGFSSAPPPGGTARPDQHRAASPAPAPAPVLAVTVHRLSSRFETNRRPIPSQSKFQVPTNPRPSPTLHACPLSASPSLHTPPAARSRVDFPPSASHLGRSLICRRLAICLFCLVSPDK